MLKSLKIIFIGTSVIAEKYLKYLLKLKYKIIAIITKYDKFLDKKKKNSKIKILAKYYKVHILQPKLLLDIYYKILFLKPDIIIVSSYGNIIPKKIFNIPKLGCINVHFSLLPRWRGASPIQHAILYGDKKTGVTIIKINKYLDEGDIIFKSVCIIKNKDNSNNLYKKIIYMGIKSLIISLNLITKKNFLLEKQNNFYSTYAYKIKKKNSKIKWHLPAVFLKRFIRAFNLWPVCFFLIKKTYIKVFKVNFDFIKNNKYNIGEIINVNKNGIKINTISGILILKEIQFSGKNKFKVKKNLNVIYNFFILKNIIN